MKNIDINPAKELGASWVSTNEEGKEPEASSIFLPCHLLLF